jgi:hypothetical protein
VGDNGKLPGAKPTDKALLVQCKGRCDTVAGLTRPLETKDTPEYCCLRRALWSQPDFQEEENSEPAIKTLIKSRGHIFLALPKYHCELNFIEMYWGRVKYELRKENNGVCCACICVCAS